MKHSWRITLLLIFLFIISQYVGIFITSRYVRVTQEQSINPITGEKEFERTINVNDLPYAMERPPVEEKSSFIYIFGAIILGTIIFLLLIRFKRFTLWKLWFLLAVILCLLISLAPFIPEHAALLLAIILACWKIFRPNPWIHNFTELFIYAGLAAIFVPIMNISSIIILLILISVYDVIAVRKTKHMVTLATAQTNAKMFAGFSLGYQEGGTTDQKVKVAPSTKTKAKVKGKARMAILGGGDVCFPLLFAGVVMKDIGLVQSLIIPITAAISLGYLFYTAEKGKFYPAMPYLSVGCLVGYGLALLI
ncbi:hypothetical protein J4460_04520 [Candidatus Woesearchaeota archaeon]|nr:hypothetical protein [Candidatus Woesearchaeota archaeon]HIH37585.1 hypothetical protein [Candidatus Woesearchaeota archaeon]